ncbi:CopG family antitoxin [Nitratireductor basaltis]|uniref:Uncharacterized protein n=1 Tax=Nitratireductor basaltis TaxID=472175 RepID=A0A084U7X9_9HYPH|nr:CopG family antitoxin [Nitratireductor basaltis]KFB09065.1 hypothetical protein EL18_00079 [Nitratireductor basaltis]
MPRTVPELKTDEEAEAFLEQDLSDLDFSQFRPMRFEIAHKSERVNMRMPKDQLDLIKREAAKRGLPYQRFMRELVTRGLETLKP